MSGMGVGGGLCTHHRRNPVAAQALRVELPTARAPVQVLSRVATRILLGRVHLTMEQMGVEEAPTCYGVTEPQAESAFIVAFHVQKSSRNDQASSLSKVCGSPLDDISENVLI